MNATERHNIVNKIEESKLHIIYQDEHGYSRVKCVTERDFVILEDGREIDMKEVPHERFLIAVSAYHPAMEITEHETVSERGDATVRTHPSYGIAQFNRISGMTTLFDSEIRHQHFIRLRIQRAEINEDSLSRHVWPTSRVPLIEVDLSEVEFGRLVSGMNNGSGSPCTIHSLDGDHMPVSPPKESVLDRHEERIDRFADEVRECVNPAIDKLSELLENKKRPTLKQMEEMKKFLVIATGNLKGNAKFVHEQLLEATEDAMAKVKTEVDGYVRHVQLEAGVNALKMLPHAMEETITQGETDLA